MAGDQSLTVTAHIDVERFVRRMFFIALAFVPINLVLGFLRFVGVGDDSPILGVLSYFDLGEELTMPAWFTAVLLAMAAVAAWVASQQPAVRAPYGRGFKGSAVLLAYLSLDEATQLHERTSDPLRAALDLRGFLYFSWVIPASVLVLVVAAFSWRFLSKLPRDCSVPLFTAAVIYVGCALGLELAAAYAFDRGGASAVTDILSMIEEIGEITAVLIGLRTMVVVAGAGFAGLADDRFPRLLPEWATGRRPRSAPADAAAPSRLTE
jgi:hypothetical protein